MTQRYAHENWKPKKETINNIEQLIADTVVTYWHTPLNESNEATVKQSTND